MNKDRKKTIHLIVHAHEGGFFSNFNKVTSYLNSTPDRVVKITWNLQGNSYGAFAYSCGEVFGKLFKPFDLGEHVDDVIELYSYNDTSYTGREVHDKYTLHQWRYDFNKTLEYFSPTPLLSSYIARLKNSNSPFTKKRVIGVLKRNDRLSCEQVSNRMPTLESYFEEIDKLVDEGDPCLYLAVDNITDLQAFIEKYRNCIYNTMSRRSVRTSDEEPHFMPGDINDALSAYLEVYALSLCSTFIHPISNMATAALYFNPDLKSIYI